MFWVLLQSPQSLECTYIKRESHAGIQNLMGDVCKPIYYCRKWQIVKNGHGQGLHMAVVLLIYTVSTQSTPSWLIVEELTAVSSANKSCACAVPACHIVLANST